jgi:hypothetical protein
MKIRSTILAAVLAFSAAAQSVPSVESVTVSTTAVSLAAATIGGGTTGKPEARYCFLSLATAAIRWRVDGIAPTDTVGHIMASASSLEIYGAANIKRFQAIRDDAADGILTVSCWEQEPY